MVDHDPTHSVAGPRASHRLRRRVQARSAAQSEQRAWDDDAQRVAVVGLQQAPIVLPCQHHLGQRVQALQVEKGTDCGCAVMTKCLVPAPSTESSMGAGPARSLAQLSAFPTFHSGTEVA